MERKIGYSSNTKTIFRDFLGFWDFPQKKIPIPGIWDFSGFWLRDFSGEKNSQIPGIWDLGIGIPKKSHPKATSALASQIAWEEIEEFLEETQDS